MGAESATTVRTLIRARLQCVDIWPRTGLQSRTVAGRQPVAARLYTSIETLVGLRMLETEIKSKQRPMVQARNDGSSFETEIASPRNCIQIYSPEAGGWVLGPMRCCFTTARLLAMRVRVHARGVKAVQATGRLRRGLL